MKHAIVRVGWSTAFECAPEHVGEIIKCFAKLTPVNTTFRDGKEIWHYDAGRDNIKVELIDVILPEAPPEID